MAIIYQISLHGDTAFDARELTWAEAIERSTCKPDRSWRDPLHDRPILKGEFGCAVSHLKVWHKIANSGLNGIILEEDAVFDSINIQTVSAILKHHSSAWLGYRWNSMGYWYNCHAYAITPETARELIKGFSEAIIPVDEWVPKILSEKNNFFFKPEIASQISREIRPSTIEDTEMLVELLHKSTDTDFRIITIATEPNKMWALEQSAKKYGTEVINLGKDHPWRDAMTGKAGMPKVTLLYEYLKDAPEDAIILFMDGYDTFFADHPLDVLKRFYEMDADIVFGAESECWPLKEAADVWPDTGTKYKYLNSGLYIGKSKALHDLIAETKEQELLLPSNADDQLFFQDKYLNNNSGYSIKLDVEAYIFQNHDPNIRVVNGQLWNDATNCCGCIYHGNGGEDAKSHFVTMAEKFDLVPEAEIVTPYYLTLDFKEVAPEILVTDFLSETQCEYLIEKSESHGNWGQMDGDKFPAQEIRIRELGLWHEYERLWHEKLGKIAEAHWKPMEHMGLRDAFTMRYAMDTQKSLGYHTDASLVTGSVKLNDNYTGAELFFPRQQFSNADVKIGQCILFPSEVTHGHYVNELQSGVKYSLTMWTSRYKGDVNG